jgi:hypothetical protein
MLTKGEEQGTTLKGVEAVAAGEIEENGGKE